MKRTKRISVSKGVQYILLSTLCFSLVNVFVKLMGKPSEILPNIQEYPPHELIFFRSLISLSITAAILKQRRIPLLGTNKKWLIIRGVFGVLALTSFFYTLKELPMAVAVTVQYLSPLFTIIFAIWLIKEKVRPAQWLFFAVALAGVAVISLRKADVTAELSQASLSPFWIGIGVMSALFSGIAYTAIIKCKETDSALNIVLYFPLIATPVMGIWCLFDFVMPQGIEWLFLLIIGLFTQFAQVFMTKALHADSASKITPFKYLGAVYAFFIGLLMFGEILNWSALIGVMLILIGVLGNALLKKPKKIEVVV